MANVLGTEGADILTGTNVDPLFVGFGSGSDTIEALGGDDTIAGSTGSDTVKGGAGKDTIDFSSVDKDLYLASSGGFVGNVGFARRVPPDNSEQAVLTTLDSVETIIGNPNKSNTINDFSRLPPSNPTQVDIDLATGQATYTGLPGNIPTTYSFKNFDNINTPFSSGRLAGSDRNNKISGGTGSVLIGSKGNDDLFGKTIDYSSFDRFVTYALDGTVNKGSFGLDKVSGFQKIIGATSKGNTLDASKTASGSSLDVNLATNSLKVTLADGSAKQTEVVNFVNVTGSTGNDTIVGSNANSKLTGGGGNDTITGGSKNDRLTGTNNTARGVGEVDTLTGGGGRDKFILGDRNGAYYLGNGGNDYATITDFNVLQDSIDIGSLKDYSFALEGANTIDLFSGKDVNTRDLVAKIQLADLGLTTASKGSSLNNRMMSMATSLDAGASTGIDALSAKLDILSGASSTADAVI
jgi:Ca2+-binding RTX toxin-like protein